MKSNGNTIGGSGRSRRRRAEALVILTVLLLTCLIATMTCCSRTKVVFLEDKYKVQELDETHLKITKALYLRLLSIINDLETENARLKLKVGGMEK